MNKKEIDFILQEREGQFIEFKESLDKTFAKEVAAFANASGGQIFLGVDDKGNVKGIEITNKIKSQIQDIANNCDPSVSIKFEEFKNILIVVVVEGNDKPYSCSSGFYMRIGPNSQKMKRNEIIEFAISLGKIRFDNQINKKFNLKKDLDLDRFNEYLKKASLTKNLPIIDMLTNLGIAEQKNKRDYINQTGVLFFAKNPNLLLRHAYVDCIRFNGTEKIDIIDRILLDKDLITNIDEAIKFVKRNTRIKYEIKDIKRKEIPEYPIEAIRESVINAVMHRDYFSEGANVSIEIYDDRIEISNPGSLPKDLGVNDLSKKCFRRNPLIADILHRISYVEKAGTGIGRIKKAMKEYNLPEPVIEINGFFTIILRSEKVTEKVTENQANILDAISKDNSITSEKLSLIIGISVRKTKENLAKLKQKGLLKRIGPDKGGRWEVL